MDNVAYPNVTYGSLTSLYQSLDISTILQLERAILHRSLRNFFQALAIFDSFPMSVAVKPAVCLEQISTLLEEYRFREAGAIAARGLSAFCMNSTGDEDHGPAILLRALLAGLDCLTEGSTHGCYASLQEIYDWLINVSVANFTDVQVWAVNLYYYLPTILSPPEGTCQFPDIPLTPLNSSCSGITLLRRHLQHAGRLNEALLLLDTETALLPSKDAEIEAMESLRSSCLEPSNQPLIHIQGTTALKLALVYASLGDDEGYREEMFSAAVALSVPKDSEFYSHLLRTDTWLARLELARARGEGPGAEAWELFADYAAKVGDYRVEAKALTEALENMIRPGSEEAEDVLPENRQRLRERLDELYARLGSSFHRPITRRGDGGEESRGEDVGRQAIMDGQQNSYVLTAGVS
ncbi:MAG: hypothetical protein Q9181_005679 [Wetmoreana brouardii]